MALSKPSLATVIQEHEFWLRLGTFLHEPLKDALLEVLHNSSNDPTYQGLPVNPLLLYQEFVKQQNVINKLIRKRILQQDQVDLLLPPNDNKTDSSKFDVTLIVILIINFTTLPPPINGWRNKNPLSNDRSKGAAAIRGREWRNYFHHTDPKDIDQAKFNQKWKEGTQIIVDLGYNYDTNALKTISLDPKHEVVLQSLHLLLATFKTNITDLESKVTDLESKVDSNAASQSKFVNSLHHQVNKLSNEVHNLQQHRGRDQYLNKKSSSTCLTTVLEHISNELKQGEAEDLVTRLCVQGEGDLVEKCKPVPWEDIKRELQMLGRADVVKYITKNTLITRGLQNASDELRNHYKIELINCLIEQPLSSLEMDVEYASREEIYIDLVVLPSLTVDQQWSNSDRDAVMKQDILETPSKVKAVDYIIDRQDEMVFVRGVAGVGKSTMIDMLTLKWAKNELNDSSMFDFVFKFNCRELNQISNQFTSVDELLNLQYPEIFCNVTLKDLDEVSDRVLFILDGVDELKDIYKMDGSNASTMDPTLQTIFDLLNLKSAKVLKDHKAIVCGRPKACEFVKHQISKSKIKTVEVCGFSHRNVQKYINNFFKEDKAKADKVQHIITSSYNLKIMSTVPVLLWVICHIYSEDLIKNPINTNTELYFFACLVFLRNHFQGCREYTNLLDMVNDQNIIDVVYSLMVLSTKTYMQNQVLFTDDDIKKLQCSIHLEQTGFIVKYSLSSTAKSTYQFRHLILQEFLCGMYMCVTKGISPFLSNRELTSCIPTIRGIDRIIKENNNDIFLQFYNGLMKSNKKLSNIFKKLSSPIRLISYNRFFKKFKIPNKMLKDGRLYITDEPECREFLDLFKETNHIEGHSVIEDARRIDITIYKDFKNILNLLEKLNVRKIVCFYMSSADLFDDHGKMDESAEQFLKLTIGRESSVVTTITFWSVEWISCSTEYLDLDFGLSSCPPRLPDIIKELSYEFDIKIRYLSLSQVDRVQGCIQDLAKYAIDHHKIIAFERSDHLQHFLEKSSIDTNSEYVKILD